MVVWVGDRGVLQFRRPGAAGPRKVLSSCSPELAAIQRAHAERDDLFVSVATALPFHLSQGGLFAHDQRHAHVVENQICPKHFRRDEVRCPKGLWNV